VTFIGAATCLFAATVGMVQTDIKRVIAYSTCSQLGYMFFAAGVGAYGAAIHNGFGAGGEGTTELAEIVSDAVSETGAAGPADMGAVMKAAMARDRAEVAARGPAQASIAKKLPTESGGTMTSAIFSEQEEAEGRRNAQ
jgi:hypothetical protein